MLGSVPISRGRGGTCPPPSANARNGRSSFLNRSRPRSSSGSPGPSLRASLTDWEITVPPGAACSSSRAAHRIAEQPGPRREHGALMNRHAQRDRHRVSDAGCRRGAMREPGPLQGIGDLLEFQQRAVTAQVADLPAAPLRLGLPTFL